MFLSVDVKITGPWRGVRIAGSHEFNFKDYSRDGYFEERTEE